MRPFAPPDGCDGPGLIDEAVPCVACGGDDVVVAVEDAVSEPVGAQILPDVLDRIQFGRARGQEDERDVFRHGEFGGRVPAGAVEQQDGMGALCDRPGDLVEMGLHGVGVSEGHGERGADTASRADRPEQPGALVALIGGLARPGPAPGPLPDQTVLLADAGLVLEPEFNRLAPRQMGEMGLQRRREAFLKASIVRSS